MALLTPGAFADTVFPGGVWSDGVWAEYLIIRYPFCISITYSKEYGIDTSYSKEYGIDTKKPVQCDEGRASMNIITCGYGIDSRIITRGYGVSTAVTRPFCISITYAKEYGINTSYGGCT